MTRKTHTTALVLIPPAPAWPPIQAIRERHDRKRRRWMPHITLVYPFRPRAQFEELRPALTAACRDRSPLHLRLEELRCFHHGRSHTLWLAPSPSEGIAALQATLQVIVPDCDEQSRYSKGFTPHLSVGQVNGRTRLAPLQSELQQNWPGLDFTVSTVSMIHREEPPGDVFHVVYEIPLGGPLPETT